MDPKKVKIEKKLDHFFDLRKNCPKISQFVYQNHQKVGSKEAKKEKFVVQNRQKIGSKIIKRRKNRQKFFQFVVQKREKSGSERDQN